MGWCAGSDGDDGSVKEERLVRLGVSVQLAGAMLLFGDVKWVHFGEEVAGFRPVGWSFDLDKVGAAWLFGDMEWIHCGEVVAGFGRFVGVLT